MHGNQQDPTYRVEGKSSMIIFENQQRSEPVQPFAREVTK
jgi:hypothetical protein